MITLKIKPGYIVKKVMGSYMLVSIDGEGGSMQTMNETGAFLWEQLSKDTTVDRLVDALLSEYDTDAATARADVTAFLAKLKASDLLDE